jgi:hypothetical protein
MFIMEWTALLYARVQLVESEESEESEMSSRGESYDGGVMRSGRVFVESRGNDVRGDDACKLESEILAS